MRAAASPNSKNTGSRAHINRVARNPSDTPGGQEWDRRALGRCSGRVAGQLGVYWTDTTVAFWMCKTSPPGRFKVYTSADGALLYQSSNDGAMRSASAPSNRRWPCPANSMINMLTIASLPCSGSRRPSTRLRGPSLLRLPSVTDPVEGGVSAEEETMRSGAPSGRESRP